IEGVGAGEMYQYLLSMQIKPAGLLEEVRNRINHAFGIPNRSWGLEKNIEKTPFSARNMVEPLPVAKDCFTPSELARACADDDYTTTLAGVMATAATNLQSIE